MNYSIVSASQALQRAQEIVAELGYRVSAASRIDRRGFVYAYSVESFGGAAYGHPRVTIVGRLQPNGTYKLESNQIDL